MSYSLQADTSPTFRQSRLQRINRLGERILRKKCRTMKLCSPQAEKKQKISISINQLIVRMIWCDKQLATRINLFPSQLLQFEKELPDKVLRPTLKLINTIIGWGQKEIKNDDINWKEQAVYFLQQTHALWEMRWSVPEYSQAVEGADPAAITRLIDQAFLSYGINKEPGLGRGLALRYLMDIDK